MPSDYHLVVAAQLRGSAERAGALSQRRASQLVAMFYLPYDADSVREVEEALAACGLAPTRPLSPDKPKEQVVVTIVGDSSFDDDIVGCMLDDTVIVLRDGQISSPLGGGPVAGAHATVDTAGQLTSRITATRWLLTGPLALAWQKKIDTRELYLMIEGVGWAISAAVDPTQGAGVRAFAAKINAAASAPPAPGSPAPVADIPDQIRKLGELRDSGLLTDEEFTAKKAELLERL